MVLFTLTGGVSATLDHFPLFWGYLKTTKTQNLRHPIKRSTEKVESSGFLREVPRRVV